MSYDALANLVMVIHIVLIGVVFIGILISIRYKRFRPIESLILLAAIVIWSLYAGCPLTHLENHLRISAGTPLPLTEIGFIPYYLNQWLSFSITDSQLTLATYTIAALFLITSVEWLSPFVNPEIVKIRKILGRKRFVANQEF